MRVTVTPEERPGLGRLSRGQVVPVAVTGTCGGLAASLQWDQGLGEGAQWALAILKGRL